MTDSLLIQLKSPNPGMRRFVVEGLGKIQDSNAVDALVQLIEKDADSALWPQALFALGQTGYAGSVTTRKKIEVALLGQEPRLNGVAQFPEALGKTGSGESARLLTGELKRTTNPAYGRQVLLAAGRLAIRKVTDPSLNAAVVAFTNDPDDRLRSAAVYAVMRMNDSSLTNALIGAIDDKEAQVRMDAVRGLGALKLSRTHEQYKNTINALIKKLHDDGDWRVRANAAAAIGNYKLTPDEWRRVFYLSVLDPSRDKNLHVRLTGLRSMAASYAGSEPDQTLVLNETAARNAALSEWQEQAEILITLARMAKESWLMHPAWGTIVAEKLKDSNGYLRARVVEALGLTKSERAIDLIEPMLKDSFALVQNNAIDALAEIGGKRSRRLIYDATQTTDVTLLSIAAGYLAGDEDVLKNRSFCDSVAMRIVASYRNVKPPIDVEAQTGIFDALGKLKSATAVSFLETYLGDSDAVVSAKAVAALTAITGKKAAPIASRPEPAKWDDALLDKIVTKRPRATIVTGKGNIEIDLMIDEAPLTVMNFIRLAERKFFDGLRFHRVVPNFVIQGGDPLGTGWGGPGYSIRAEFSTLSYERGMVGMASAGKDTEGCQWFITHSWQPHLDGRYTIFARVRKGMEIADEIQVGDAITSVRIWWP